MDCSRCTRDQYATIPWVAFGVIAGAQALSVALADLIVTATYAGTIGDGRFFLFAAVQSVTQFSIMVFLATTASFGGGSLASADAYIRGANLRDRFYFTFTGNEPGAQLNL